MFSIYLFDLDGTVTASAPGIIHSAEYALSRMGIEYSADFNFNKIIGPPLRISFMKFFSLNDQDADTAVKYYREYYSDKGIFENSVYDGIEAVLAELQNRKKIVSLATSKPTVYAERILDHFYLTSYFDRIQGSNVDGTLSKKADVIACVLGSCSAVSLKEICMIGDRKEDIDGAKQNSIQSCGVLYGYGLRDEFSEADFIIQKPDEILNL